MQSGQWKIEACPVAGRWIAGDQWIDVDNPATGETIGRVPALGAAETRLAIDAAEAAMVDWAAQTGKHRAAILRNFFDLMMAHQEELACLLTEEQGKPLAEARGEIAYAASFLEWFGEEAKRLYGDVVPSYASDKRLIVVKQPIGVVGCITPWNFPSAMITRKIGPALAAGCGVVLKPALQTPFSALALARLGEEAGLPAGLFNIVTGRATEIGRELTENPKVRKISFTGSTEVGAKLFAQSAPTIKKLSLELGGNAPFIVFDDADLDAAVQGAIMSKFRNAGQTCVCANRFYVQDGVYDAFIERFAAAAEALVIGDGADKATQVGPLIDQAAVEKVREHVADASAKGAKLVCGGPSDRGGRFYRPTIMRDVDSSMLVANEETFGPLAGVIRFSSEQDVIAQANATPFGLAAYFFARDLGRVWRVAEALETGIVGVNTGIISTELAPFGGVKQSGLGREGSRYGIEDYVEMKYICMGF
ncbi:NAD-dependent succinate-semialdehyde dehydrogenase [Rhizorhabdus dicambivorans]|uniref:NAD-dependent succinate-semialdehyde dehydrogenase n=1 Tax=Rhizorhabdus dicambivorans TaxID=1850238 RepID=A0A2A4FVN6_9SPHN|nr:NAD-dependent succinate-semialdehyde dehydrogenase [Rhizorhabdus dicambivorans]ATE66241.1 NAD-dependent succinate-semialdehyde dehydrogenase [Rhizorhabdus dicambivorans]PCE41754.1 NAD-dependent succinate-semialdehyde dehydrogenase [Rhizorhabdus dicambivorans]